MPPLIQLFLALLYLAVLCYIAYKVGTFLMEKLVDLIFASRAFRLGFCLFLGLAFFALGIVQLSDFLKGTSSPYLFSLSLGITGLISYLGILAYRQPKR